MVEEQLEQGERPLLTAMSATADPLATYNDLYVYTTTRGREQFVLQHVVDAFAAQTATETTKPIALTFALIGLYLHVEKGFSGREVQRVHMKLAKTTRVWPRIVLPAQRGEITPAEVMAFPAGDERDAAISEWCRSVWEAFRGSRPMLVEWFDRQGIS